MIQDRIISPEDVRFKIIFNYELLDDSYCIGAGGQSNDSFFLHLDTILGEKMAWSNMGLYDDNHHLVPEAQPYTESSTARKLNHPLMIMVKEQRVVSLFTKQILT